MILKLFLFCFLGCCFRYEVRDKLCAEIDSGTYDTVVVNFANPDMVGHTGSIPAVSASADFSLSPKRLSLSPSVFPLALCPCQAVAACEAVDQCLGVLIESVERLDGNLVRTVLSVRCMCHASLTQ